MGRSVTRYPNLFFVVLHLRSHIQHTALVKFVDLGSALAPGEYRTPLPGAAHAGFACAGLDLTATPARMPSPTAYEFRSRFS